MLTVLLTMALSAAPAPAREPLKLAAPGLDAANLTDSMRQFCSDHLAQQLALLGVRVTTPSEIGAILGLERQKQLLGCADEAKSCMVELANALGVDAVVMGSIGRFGDNFHLNLKVVASSDARPLALYSAKAGGEEELLDALTVAAAKLAPELAGKLSRSLTPPKGATGAPPSAVDVAGEARSPLQRWALAPAIAGVVLAGTGAILFTQSEARARELETSRTLTAVEAAGVRDQGRRLQTWGWVATGVGAAALATSAVLFGIGSREGLAFAPLSGGGALVATVELP